MDDGLHEPVKKTRLLAWATAALLVMGVAATGVVGAGNDGADRRIVRAAGSAEGLVPPTTLAEVVPPPATAVAPPTTVPVPKPRPTAPPTTQPPRTTTTKPLVTTPPTTAAPVAGGVTVNVVNQHPLAVAIEVNGSTFTLAPGQQSGPVAIQRYPHGNDIVEVSLVQEPTCGMGDAGGYFTTPSSSYTLTVVASKGLCQAGMPSPEVKSTPA